MFLESCKEGQPRVPLSPQQLTGDIKSGMILLSNSYQPTVRFELVTVQNVDSK